MTVLVRELGEVVGVTRACTALGVPRPSYYRRSRPAPRRAPNKRPSPPRALGPSEQQEVIEVLHSERFVDHAPAQVVASLLQEGIYHCSARTMYRILSARGEVRERRNQLVHPRYQRPELLATGPNQVWTWDITKLRATQKWTYYYLYVTLKSRPDYPDRFGSYEDAHSFCRRTFDWYNHEHHHSGLVMLTPAEVHYGHSEKVLAKRQRVLDAAYAAQPERFVNGPPKLPSLPQAVWINPPEDKSRSEIKLH